MNQLTDIGKQFAGIGRALFYSFTPWGRAIADRKLAEENARLRLRMVAGDRYDHYHRVAMGWKRWTGHVNNLEPSKTEAEAITDVARLVMAGFEPKEPLDIIQMTRLMNAGYHR